MIARQKQSLEAFVRVGIFVEAHPVAGPLSYAGPRETLADVVRSMREHAGAQLSGRELSRAELRLQEQLIRRLIDRHMRPIVAIARAQIETDSDVRVSVALRMPTSGFRATRMLQAADGMIEGARPFEAVFIANGMPVDFLARFTAARNELDGVLGGRAAHVGAHVAARKALEVQMRRGRRAVDRIDAVVRASFDGDEVTLGAWRVAKRVHLVSGGGTRGREEGQPETPTEARIAA
jgi:hypothetical protein